MSVTPAQFEVLVALGDISKPATIEQIVDVTGRSKGSVRGLVNRLLGSDPKLITESKAKTPKLKLLKAGRIALLSKSNTEELERTLKTLSVDEIEQMQEASLVHLTGVLLKAKSLPKRALTQLAELVKKHGLGSDDKVSIQNWPGYEGFQYDGAKNTGMWPERPQLVSEVIATFNVNKSNATWGSGRVYVESHIHTTGAVNDIDYPAGFEFHGEAARKVAERLKKSAGDLARFRVCAICETNYIGIHTTQAAKKKGGNGTGNPRYRVYDLIELD